MKNLFNAGIISSTMRKIKTVAIVITILSVVNIVTSYLGVLFLSGLDYWSTQTVLLNIGGAELLYSLPFLAILGSFIMTLIALNYLDHRVTCDFYHALPQRRQTVFASSIAGVVLTVGLSVLTAGLAAMAIGVMLMPILNVNFLELLVTVLNCIVAAFLVSAATGFAMSITGTPFSNIILSLIVIFLPQMLLILLKFAVNTVLPSYIDGNTVANAIPCLNLATSFVYRDILLNGWATLYSLILGCGYFALGCLLSVKRKSEMAGVSAPSNKMQAVYRVLIGFAMFSVVTAALFMYVVSGINEDFEVSAIFNIVFISIYITISILYFVFELIMTKKWKNVLKAIPGLCIVIVLAGSFFGLMYLTYQADVSFKASAAQINSVEFAPKMIMDTDGEYDFADYECAKAARTAFDDEELKEVVSKELDNAVSQKSSYYDYYREDDEFVASLKINKGFVSKTRKLTFTGEDAQLVRSYYEKMKTSVCEQSDEKMSIRPDEVWISGDFTEKQSEELSKTLANELSGYTLKEWEDINKDREDEYYFYARYQPSDIYKYSSEYNESLFTKLFPADYYSDAYVHININAKTVPETYALIMKYDKKHK